MNPTCTAFAHSFLSKEKSCYQSKAWIKWKCGALLSSKSKQCTFKTFLLLSSHRHPLNLRKHCKTYIHKHFIGRALNLWQTGSRRSRGLWNFRAVPQGIWKSWEHQMINSAANLRPVYAHIYTGRLNTYLPLFLFQISLAIRNKKRFDFIQSFHLVCEFINFNVRGIYHYNRKNPVT